MKKKNVSKMFLSVYRRKNLEATKQVVDLVMRNPQMHLGLRDCRRVQRLLVSRKAQGGGSSR